MFILTLIATASIFFSNCTKEGFPIFYPGDSQQNTGSGQEEKPNIPQPGDSPDWSKLTAEAHPRVIFTDNDFTLIKESIQKNDNEILKTIHHQILGNADKALNAADLQHKLDGKRLLSVSRDAEQRLLSCAYAFKVTGDAKYKDRAIRDLTTVCNFPDWNAKKHFLDVGEMAAGVGLAYDWLYAELPDELKASIRKAINDFAFTPAQNGIWNLNFYDATNNWNQVCNGGLVCAALATYESNSSVAQSIIQKAIETNISAMKGMYSPDGNYPEGYSYWCYGTLYEALMLSALESATGTDTGLSKTDGFSKTGKFMLFMEGPTDMCYNFSDCAASTMPCLAQWYFAEKFDDLSLLYLEKDRISKYGSCAESRLLPLIAWYASKTGIKSFDAIPAPTDFIYKGDGTTPVVLIHENWKLDITDKFLGIKGGKANTSHGHMDAGSFVYDADGVRWSADLGLQSYGTLEPYINLWDMNDGSERWTAFRYNNFNHSTITVNDKHHKAGGVAKITGLLNVKGQKGAIVDMTGPLVNEVSTATRTIYMEGDELFVKDDITAKKDKTAKIRWTMVTRANPTIEFGAVTLKSSTGKYRYLKTSSPTGHRPSLKTWTTVSKNDWDAPNTGYYECGYELTLKQGENAVIITKLTPEE